MEKTVRHLRDVQRIPNSKCILNFHELQQQNKQDNIIGQNSNLGIRLTHKFVSFGIKKVLRS